MKKMLVVTMFIIVGLFLLFLRGCVCRGYTVIDCTPQEIQSVIAEVNSGIGEGRYEKILIVNGKDPILLSSCTVSEREWKRIYSKGQPSNGQAIIVKKMIVPGNAVQNPLGCYQFNGIDFYGFARGESDVYLIICNFGDAGGKFPKKLWDVISKNTK